MITGIFASASGKLPAFTDEFAGDGALASRWLNTSGSWSRVSGRATTSNAASTYPIAAFNARTREVSVRTEPGGSSTFGWGVSFWVVDANNWWAAVADRTAYSCQVGTTTGCCACPDSGSGNDCSCAGCNCCNCVTGAVVSFAGTCTYPVFGTCYSYNLRLIRSVSGIVSTISTVAVADGNIGSSLTIGYVQVVTNTSGQITATAQMSTGGTIAQIQTTPSSPNRGFRHGMIITPATNGTQANSLERYIYAPA
jgi:hypothetical protein